MAESEQDDSSKTEEPTSKRLEQGRERGQVAISQDVKSWAILVAGAGALMLMAPGVMRDIAEITLRFIERPEALSIDIDDARQAMAALVLKLALTIAPIIGLLCVVALGVSLAQIGLVWAPSKINPAFERVSLVKGLHRLASLPALVEFVKGLIKLAVVGAIAFGSALPLLKDIALLPSFPLSHLVERLHRVALALTVGTVAVMTIVAIVDYAYQRFSFLKQMRMTKQEVRDELKQQEGDPQIKARIRRLRVERARQRMMAAVPSADVVIANPTHVSVALAYDMQAMAAPKLVAKGIDHLAQRIREVAEEHQVPIVENPPLARALYASVELDQEIPQEHYQAVAQVIGYVMRLKSGLA